MIYESEYWKQKLGKNALWLADSIQKKRWNANSFGKLEETIMVSFYAIRKLYESLKIPKEFIEKSININYYAKKESIITKLNCHKIEDHYDLYTEHSEKIKVGFLLNQIIHSYLFIPIFGKDKRIVGLLVNSDHSKDSKLYSIKYKRLIDIVIENTNHNINIGSYKIENGEWKYITTIYKNHKLDEWPD